MMTEFEDEIKPPTETAKYQGRTIQLLPIKLKQMYLGEFPRGKVKRVRIGDEPNACERLRVAGFNPYHVFVTQIDQLRQNDKSYRNSLDPIPIMKVCINCGLCQVEGSNSLIKA